jgi:CheY-like chemotaxis protein
MAHAEMIVRSERLMKRLIQWGGQHRILIVDDEPDIHTVTRLSLKGLSRKCGPVEFLSASTGKETLRMLEQYPDIGVILLDVVMETDTAGLEACRAIRNDLNNPLVRILLRTGQPGVAPEQQTIDTYDIDGYLAKTETSSNRLYTAVRCAMKSFQELVTLERHRAYLTAVHDCAVALNADVSIDRMLRQVIETVLSLCPAEQVLLELETFEQAVGPRQMFLHLGSGADAARSSAAAEAARSRVHKALSQASPIAPGSLGNGFLVPLSIHRELGHGWIFVDGFSPDPLAAQTLTLLAGHVQNAIYASIALSASRERRNLVFEELSI